LLLHSSSVMLALKQGLSLSSTKILGAWSPEQEASLVAWYQYQTGITLNGSDVSEWADYTGVYNMVQETAIKQPAYSSGTLTFVLADVQFLQTTGQITLAGDFTIAFRVHPTTFTGTVLGGNTDNGGFVRFTTDTQMRISINGVNLNFTIDNAGDDYYVLTRSGSDINLHQNGVLNATTRTSSDGVDIDAIGIRGINLNPFDGTMKEIQIYSSTSAGLTANVNSRLAGL
jgi:hypothetical protein